MKAIILAISDKWRTEQSMNTTATKQVCLHAVITFWAVLLL